jgi:signal transduction histidine kinase/CheY-like chemotaxis protein
LYEVAAGLLLVILASLFWNRKLAIEIRRRKSAETRLKESNRKLLEATQSAQSANRAKSTFLSNMSHEIRTPMNSILGFAELLDEQIDDQKLKSFIKTIRSSGEGLLLLINDILDLSKIESGKMNIVKTPTDVKRTVEESVALFQLQAKQKGLDLQMHVDSSIPPFALMDHVRFREILINLIGNALKFTDRGFINVVVQKKGYNNASDMFDMSVAVIDSGIGIAKESQKKIFNIFEQQDNQDMKKYGGTGLGLAISRKLAFLMDGTLGVQSKLQKGSTFTLYLRNIAVVDAKEEKTDTEETITFTEIEFDPAVVLVADDVVQNRMLITESFRDTAVKIEEVGNGKEALERVKQGGIDLVLMDIRMPVLDGYNATRMIKEELSIPVVALSASLMQKDFEKIQQQERFDAYLRKPVSKKELLQTVMEFLKHSVKNRVLETKTKDKLDSINDPKGFLQELGKIADKFYNIALKSNDIDTMQQFAQAVLDAANKFNFDYMRNFAQELIEKIEIFDIEAIEEMLKKYKEIKTVLQGRL